MLVADTDEFDLVVKKGKLIGAKELDFPEQKIQEYESEYVNAVKGYMLKNPSEAMIMSSEYYAY